MATKAMGLLVMVMISCAGLFGQVTTGTISGTVRDSTGAVMPGVAVTIRNTDTGIGRTLVTDGRGYYTAPNLSLGSYEVTASLSGFQTEVRRGITLNVGQNAVIEFTLTVGSVTERVEVTAEAPLIETTSATVSGLVNEKQVQDLPLNARNLIELAPLQAGVAFASTGEQSASKGLGTKLSISGTRYNASLFQLDGANINDSTGSAGSATGILMGAETIREFNVVINAYSAEYGNHSGGVFNAVTKSGTNSLHGSAFEFLRNDNMDATRWEDNLFGLKKPEFKRNQFGGSLGGPVIRDRTFFFGSYEGLREGIGQTRTTNVPTAALRRGELRDPATGVVRTIPVDPAVQPYLNFYPLPSPNGRLLPEGTQERFDTISLPSREDFYTVRGDHKVSDRLSLFGRYSYSTASRTVAVNLAADNFNASHNQSAIFGGTQTLSPVLINQFVVAFGRSNISDANTTIHEDVQLPATYQFVPWPGAIGRLTVPGLTDFGQVPARNYINNSYQVKDDVFYTIGAHTLKFGFNAQRAQYNHSEFPGSQGPGNFTFTTMEDFLRGITTSFTGLTLGSEPWNYFRNSLFGFYLQDDYRFSSRLTLNLGLRYEFITTPFEKYDRVSNLEDFTTPGQTPDKLILGNPTFLNPSLKNFAPRVGLAWDPTGGGKTSIRAGAGIFHNQINPGEFMYGLLANPPFFKIGAISTRGVARFPDAFYVQQDLLLAQVAMEGFQRVPEQPVVYKWSFEIQRELGTNMGITVGYSGTRGIHLIRINQVNGRFSETLGDRSLFIGTTAALVFPGFNRVRPRFTDTTSDYHAFLLTLKKRLSKGLQFQVSYTLSKTVDDASNWTGGSDWQNSPGQSRYRAIKDRGLASYDIRNVFVTSATYELPGSRLQGVAGHVLGGWQTSAIVSLRGGNPSDTSTGVSPAHFRNGFIGDYPDRIASTEIKYDTRNPEGYFDPSAFHLPPGYTTADRTSLGGTYVGNAARGSIIAPGSATVDLVLQKVFTLTERFHLQFRSEFFNMLNRPNFGAPSGRIFASATGTLTDGSPGTFHPNVGTIRSTTGSARQIQFGLRLEF